MNIRMVFLAMLCMHAIAADTVPMKRLALFVGANNGGVNRQMLRYAASDAKSISRLLSEMGGIDRNDSIVMLEPNAAEFSDAFDRMRGRSMDARAAKRRVEFFFYYSGHSDEEGLILNKEKYSYAQLRRAVNGMNADVRIVILDSCASGSFTRYKGGKKTQPFLVDVSVDVKGHAFLMSSSANEVSQESDAIEGSFFTHHLIAGLRGAADANRDKKVTLTEAYNYAFAETLAKTENTTAGPQHPNYDIQLAGSGDVTMTDLKRTASSLVIAEALSGRVAVRDASDYLIAEINKMAGHPVEIGVEPGEYKIGVRNAKTYFETSITVAKGERIVIGVKDLRSTALETTVTRGDAGINVDRSTVTVATNGNASVRSTIRDTGRSIDTDRYGYRYDFFGPLVPERWLTTNAASRIHSLCLGIVGSDADILNGFALSLIANQSYREVNGVRISGIYGSSTGNFNGADIAGVSSIVNGTFTGMQAGSIVNYASGNVVGMQGTPLITAAAGLLVSAFTIRAFDFARIAPQMVAICVIPPLVSVNLLGGNLYGMQYGVFNHVGSNAFGLQYGLINHTVENAACQIGLLNMSRSSFASIGILNIAEESAMPLALVNIIMKGQIHPRIWADDLGFLNFGYKGGNRWLFTTFDIGTAISDFSVLSINAGIGVTAPLDPLFIDMELSGGMAFRSAPVRSAGTVVYNGESYNTQYNDGHGDTSIIRVKISAGWKFLEHLGVFIGISYTRYFENDRYPYSVRGWRGYHQIPAIAVDGKISHYLGLFGGVQF